MHQLLYIHFVIMANVGALNFAAFKGKLTQQGLAETVQGADKQLIQLIQHQLQALAGIADLIGVALQHRLHQFIFFQFCAGFNIGRQFTAQAFQQLQNAIQALADPAFQLSCRLAGKGGGNDLARQIFFQQNAHHQT